MIPDLDTFHREVSTQIDAVDAEFFAQVCASGVRDKVPWVRLLNGDTLFGYSKYEDTTYRDIFDRHRAAFTGLGLAPAAFGAAFDAMVSYGRESCEFPRLVRKSSFITKGAVVIDVGARAGHFLVKASRLAGPQGQVIGLDATPFAEDYCQRQIAANQCDNTRFVRTVISESDDAPATFFHGSAGESSSGLFAETVGADNRKIVSASHHKGRFDARTRTVDAIVSDLGLTRCDLVILQINGGEVAAVRGMTRILNQLRPTLFVTCDQRPPNGEEPAAAIQGWVMSMGYDVAFHQGTDMVLRPVE